MIMPQINPETMISGYYYLAIFSTIIFTIKLIIFTIVGGDCEVVADFNSEVDMDCSFNFLSIQSILAFLMGFGWMGYAAIKQFGVSLWTAFGIAFAVGFIFMCINTFLMFSVKKLEKNVKKDYTKAINQTGKAYTSFAPKGHGQVEIEINEQLSIEDAVNTTDEEIKSFEMVKVVKVDKNILYIEKAQI